VGTTNNGLLDGARRIAGKFRDLSVEGGLPGVPLGFRLRGATRSGPPAAGTWKAGDLVPDRAGALWTAVSGGTPGQWAGTQVVIPPSGDQTGAKDTARINAVIQGAATAVLLPGTYYVTNLLVGSYGTIAGAGKATILIPATGTTGYVIALKTPATTEYVTVRDLIINCNNVCGGIGLDNTGYQPEVQWQPYDPMHLLQNILILGGNGDAFHFDNNVRSMRVENCITYNTSGYGFYFGTGAASDGLGATDNNITGCITGHTGNSGYYVAAESGNNTFGQCKAFYAGYSEAEGEWVSSTACGFEILSDWTTFTGCSAQQNALHGFDLNGCSYTTVTGSEADTNSAGTSVTTGCGINVNGTSYCTVIGNVGSLNSYDPPGAQAYGIQMTGTVTGTAVVGNALTGTSDGIGQSGYVNGGGNTIIDYAQAVIGATAILQGNPAAYVQGQSSFPSGEQYFAQLCGYDPASSGYGTLGFVTGAGLAGTVQQSQRAATSAVTVANSTAIASLGSLSVPASDAAAGARYRLTAHGQVSTTTGTPSATADLRWGGTGGTLITSFVTGTSSPALGASLSGDAVLFEAEVEFITSTTCVGWLRMTWRNAATTTVTALASITSAVTVTTGSAESLSLDWTWGGTATASNTITIASSSFERVA